MILQPNDPLKEGVSVNLLKRVYGGPLMQPMRESDLIMITVSHPCGWTRRWRLSSRRGLEDGEKAKDRPGLRGEALLDNLQKKKGDKSW
jgi:hypothetical protein